MRFLEKRYNKQELLPSFNCYANGALNFNSLFSNNRPSLSLSAVFGAIELISNSIAELPILVKRENLNGDKEIDKQHPINLAFDNSLINKFVLMKNLVKDLYINGEAFMYIHRSSNVVTGLLYLQHGYVSTMYNELKQELYYLAPTVSVKKIMPKDMIHLVKNTKDGINGISILNYAKKSIDLASATELSACNFIESGGAISGVLSVQGPVSDKQKEDLKNNWRMTYGAGGDNQGGVVVLPGNMTYQAIGSNPAEAQLLESRLFNLQEICRYFNLNLTMLGDLTHNSYSTLEMTLLSFLSLTLLPIIKLIECEFNKKLLNDDEKTTFSIDLDEEYLLKADKSSTANYYTSLVNNGLMTANEARLKLGLSPMEGGDELHMAFSNAESSKLGGSNENKEDSDENSDKK